MKNGQDADRATEDLQTRLECLELAVSSAKAGVAYDVFATANRYLSWAKGEAVENSDSGLDFRQRLDLLAREFLREERSDPEKIKNDVAEWFSAFETQWPAPSILAEGSSLNIHPESFVPRAVHKDIQS